MKKDSNHNIYKVSTFVLLGLIVLVGIYFGMNSILNSKYEQGLSDGSIKTVNNILSGVVNQGYITFNLGENNTVTLVPAQQIGVAQEQLIQTILTTIKTQGYIRVYNETHEVILVPAQSQQTQ